jgi:rubrerythrin
MTREEAIDTLKAFKAMLKIYPKKRKQKETVVQLETALDMAIKSLKTDGCKDAFRAMFTESEEAYKAWTGEEMGKTSDEINDMNKEIIKDILKMMPTAYLLEALGVSTFEELTEPTDRPHGEWKIDEYGIYHCPFCHAINNTVYKSFCPNCGAYMGGNEDGE